LQNCSTLQATAWCGFRDISRWHTLNKLLLNTAFVMLSARSILRRSY